MESRAQRYLGPDAPKFKLAPKAIKYEIKRTGQPISDESFVIGEAKKLVVNKIDAPQASTQCDKDRALRPLPVARNLPLEDPLNIWFVHKLPYGRLDLEKLQELLYNRLADGDYWSAKMISEKYKLNIDHAINLTKYVAAHKIICSPKVYNNLELVCLNNKFYQQIKSFAVEVDESLRTESDKRLDIIEEADTTNKDNLDMIRAPPPVEPLKVNALNAEPPRIERRRLASQIDKDRREEEIKKLTGSSESGEIKKEQK